MLKVHAVLYYLDDREDEVGVAKPTEHVIEHREVLVLHSSCDTVTERSENHTRQMREVGLHRTSHIESAIVQITRHTDDEVNVNGSKYGTSLLRSTYLSKRRRVSKAKFGIFIEQFLIYTTVIFEHESIVWISDDKHPVDALVHQIEKRDVT